jgi:acyl dehydratase
MTQRYTGLYRRRDTTPPVPEAGPTPRVPRAEPAAALPEFDDPAINATRFAHRYDDVVVGARIELGSRHFTREDIIRFATKFDPQPFHLSDEGAAQSHFGRLSASGWHTAATYMRLFVETRDRIRAQAASLPFALSPGRPSPGFRNLRWLRPVQVDDVISYATTVIGKTPHSREGLGVVHNRATGTNQKGVTVFEIEGTALAVMG